MDANSARPTRPDDAPSGAPEQQAATEARAKRNGAAALLQKMVDAHSAALYRAAFHMTGRADDAQDLVQEAFIRAWRFIDTFDESRDARGWLFKILMNVHVDYRRRQHREPQVSELLEPEAVGDLYLYKQVVESDDLRTRGDPDETFFDTLVGGEVQAALGAVPEQYRKVFLLSVEGFTYHEIAEMLGIPMGTVMSRLHRARTLLEKSLWEYCVQIGRCRQGAAAAALPAPCADACHGLYGFLDHELDQQPLSAIEGHLAVCRQCCNRLEFQQRLESTIRQELGRHRIPRQLKSRLAQLVSML